MKGPVHQALPDDPETLKALLRKQEDYYQRRIVYLQTKLEKLEAQQRLALLKRYGVSSEQLSPQERLFDEAEQAVEAPEAETPISVPAHQKRKPRRAKLPDSLPRTVHEHTLDDPHCACGGELTVIGAETSEQLDVIPATVTVIEHRRLKYACRCCDAAPKVAPMPAQAIPKSLASPGYLAFVATSKYADGLPLYRLATLMARIGIDLPRHTMAGHMVKAGELLTPLINLMRDHLIGYDLLQMDETPVQVLKEPGKAAQSKSYMWVMRGGPPGKPAVLYHYAPTRSGAVPLTLLEGYSGYLQSDDYAGYNAVLRRDDIRGVGCWAHARRRFHDALKALPKAQQSRGNRTQMALNWITKLYAIERRIKDASAEERHHIRQQESRPILEAFKIWLDKQSVPPQTLLGKAISYVRTDWCRLTTFLDDGRIPIDNNAIENAIRPFAVGRKNWLFANSQAGATASANLYSLIETAKANGLNEYAYLRYLFTKLPQANTVADVEALLPWRVSNDKLQSALQTTQLASK